MILRRLRPSLLTSLRRFPVVGLIGSRQVGKTTLARSLAAELPTKFAYLDLERPSDLAKLTEPELYLERHAADLVILDEIQRMPGLFPLLRALVDDDRRPGRFLILGSSSPEMIRRSSETLAGRIVYHELSPLSLDEVGSTIENTRTLWLRGGFPASFLSASDEDSANWREAFVQTYLERDIPSFGLRIPSTSLRRFWQMLAHLHGGLWNASKIASGLGVSAPTVRHYLDVLQDTFMVRQLEPFHANLGKRLVKAPKVYLRDSGLLHALLRIETPDDLLGHPGVGASWEGWVIEQILAVIPGTWRASFYRTGAGAEVDLVLERPGRRRPIAIEIKHAANPAPSRGFWSSLTDLGGAQGYVVCPARERFPLGRGVYALPVAELKGILESP